MSSRSFVAVAAGLAVLTALLWLGVRVVTAMPAPDTMPGPLRIFAVTVGLALAAEVPAGWTVGRLAPRRPLLHALVVAAVAAVVGAATVGPLALSGFGTAFVLNALHAPGLLLGASLATRWRRSEP